LNPPIDLRFTIADLRFKEWLKNEMMLPAVLDPWAAIIAVLPYFTFGRTGCNLRQHDWKTVLAGEN
jgi:hypothetical protein